MTHLPPLIEDLGLILAAAGVVTILFRHFGQPMVLGYIIAGVLVSPRVPFLPTISDVANIRIWAEIGVIFLLFALGLEFSFKKLVREGGSVTLTALIEVIGMGLLGYATGQFLGWRNMDSLFLGGIMSISSTTIIIRAFEEAGVKGRGFVGLVFGVLIVEDLIAILILVLFSTIAITRTFVGLELAASALKLLFFLVLWFLLGMFILPTAVRRLRRYLTDETLLIVSIGLCFVMVILTTRVGFSAALGAFIMGSLLSETAEGSNIDKLFRPVRDLFAAIFFVSVGMLIDPLVIWEHAWPIVVITLAVIFGKIFWVTISALIAGRNLRHAVQSGMSLAQIGEFSFIIATLGLSTKVTSDFIYPIAVTVSAITAFTTPYLIRRSDRVYNWLQPKIPKNWQGFGTSPGTPDSDSFFFHWWRLARAHALKFFSNAVIVSAIFIGVFRFVGPTTPGSVCLGLALLVSSPFLWAMALGRPKNLPELKDRLASLAFSMSRWFLTGALFAYLANYFVSVTVAIASATGLIIVFLAVFSRHLEGMYSRIEDRFVQNLSMSGGEEDLPPLAPWDAHITSLEVRPHSPAVGQTLEELRIRDRFGISIALVERGEVRIAAPGSGVRLFPYDKVYVIGTDEQILKFKNEIDSTTLLDSSQRVDYVLRSVLISNESPYCGTTIRTSGVREKSHGIVVGIERKGQRILNPDSSMKIEPGDLLWVVGEAGRLRQL
jgi:monovalent cation:H+ antiporter-2, CPA2 family